MSCLLVLDASSALCSVALGNQEQHWEITELQPRGHAQRLLPMVDEVIQAGGLSRRDINGLAYGRGPGSFTGIRIAASVMQGIAIALNLPVAGISSLQAVAQQAFDRSDATQVLAVMDAHMGEVFWGLFERQADLCCLTGAEHVGSPEQFRQALENFTGVIAGDGLRLAALSDLRQDFSDIYPRADVMLRLAQREWAQGAFGAIDQHQPVYLRDSVAWKKLDEQPSLLKPN
ncbi:tRNA (adenosine(37)-N6)-threonylcarbamoyltransferase complex dimerization subunit type 1 TsaB [Thalassolituus sp. LLYu03]|uniref:tRNA (adenosine(37)-N6)-threonylcarbamoyltransferase complex dimerization subunit type 1 TsaB n=1 Tax=Thalassolituus sp. LLYu03 TaxID=3421656 RepID=UPI003D2C76B9